MLRVALLIAALGIACGAREPLASGAVKDCIQVWPEARYRALGYNHIVHVRDVCDARAECSVSTDVNPDPQAVTVPGHSEIEVTTFLGSPARVFVPKADCKMVP